MHIEGINLSLFDGLEGRAVVLDLGCGAGAVSTFLVKRGFQVVGCDVDPS
jgi:cyclopropane fatty-acyl-phospholipid synthase-like methyltransferase